MIARAVNQERARSAASDELARLEPPAASPDARQVETDASAIPGKEQLATMMQLMLLGLSDVAARNWGADWRLSEPEAQGLAVPVLDVIELELGEQASDPWSRLWLALGMIAVPRVMVSVLGLAPATATSPATSPASADSNTTQVEKAAA